MTVARGWGWALAVALSTGAAWGQSADAEREARRHFERGVELTDEGNYNAAMAEFTQAWELTHNPLLLYNVGTTHEALGQYAEALEALRSYEALAPPAVVARRRAALDEAIARLRQRVGTVVVTVEAPGLEVLVDGIARPLADARRGIVVSAGRHRVLLRAPGRVPRETEHDVAGDTRVVIDRALERTRSSVAVDCDVPGAAVLIDGDVVATTPVASPLPVDEGEHRVEVRRPGYTPYATVVAARGAGARVDAALAWASPIDAAIAARVVVRASEPGALVWIDGRRVPPDGSEPVPPGRHRLRVERQEYLPTERDLDVAAGRTETVDVVLVPTPATRARWATEARRYRRYAWGSTIAGAALLVAGGVWLGVTLRGYLEHLDRRDELGSDRDYCRTNTTAPDGRQCYEVTNEYDQVDGVLIPRDDLMLLGSGIVTGVGLAALVAGVALHATAPSPDRTQRASWRPLVGPGSAGIAVSF